MLWGMGAGGSEIYQTSQIWSEKCFDRLVHKLENTKSTAAGRSLIKLHISKIKVIYLK